MQLGLLMFAGYGLETAGLRLTTASKAAFITGTRVVLVPLLSAALGQRKINRSVWTGALAVPVLQGAGWEAPRAQWGAGLAGAVLFTAIGATALAFALQIWAQRYTTPSHTAIVFSLQPVFAALFRGCSPEKECINANSSGRPLSSREFWRRN